LPSPYNLAVVCEIDKIDKIITLMDTTTIHTIIMFPKIEKSCLCDIVLVVWESTTTYTWEIQMIIGHFYPVIHVVSFLCDQKENRKKMFKATDFYHIANLFCG
jgi:hypothetical protein